MATPPLLRKLGRAERALHPHNIAKQVDAIRAKVDEIIQALANLNENITGSTSGTAPAMPFGPPVGLTANSVLASGVSANVNHADHVHSVASAAPSGGYGTAASAGIGAGFMRADATLVYPEALGAAADRTDTLTLTDDPSHGALLTASNAYAQNYLAFAAPNSSSKFYIGKWGNMAGGTSTPTDQDLLTFFKTDFADAARVKGINLSVSNTGAGSSTGVVGSARYVPGAASAAQILGIDFTTGPSNANSTGNVTGIKSTIATTGGAVRTNYFNFESVINAFSGSTLTTVSHFNITTAPTLGTLTTHVGFRQSTAFSLGSTRRGVQVANSVESSANDFIASTAAKGFIAKDAQGSPHFWRYTVAADGTPAVVDIGTSAPTT